MLQKKLTVMTSNSHGLEQINSERQPTNYHMGASEEQKHSRQQAANNPVTIPDALSVYHITGNPLIKNKGRRRARGKKPRLGDPSNVTGAPVIGSGLTAQRANAVQTEINEYVDEEEDDFLFDDIEYTQL